MNFGLKTLFRKSDADNLNKNIVVDSEDVRMEGETYKTWGFRLAGKAGGNNSVLSSALNVVEQNNRKEQIENQQQQEKSKQEIEAKLDALILKKKKLEDQKNGLQNAIEDSLEKITSFKDAYTDKVTDYEKKKQEIKNGATGTNRTSKLTLIISCFLLLALAIYLFTFYSSAVYSAFFKEFKFDDMGFGSTILDSQALSKAWHQGSQSGLFCSLLPFVFVALGFVVSQFENQDGWKSVVKTIIMYAITFVFDAILAYEISKKIYDMEMLTQLGDFPPYSIRMAFENIGFWSIIFLGFIVYLIFGFVFGFAMKTYDDLTDRKGQLRMIDKDIQKEQEKLNRKIASENNKISKMKLQVNQLSNNLLVVEQNIAQQERLINGNLIDFNALLKALNEFFMGWMSYLTGASSGSEKKTLAQQIFNNKISEVNNSFHPQKKDAIIDQLTLKTE
ncbi:MAG: hypothetical protein MJ069_01940 [Salinivirgaceae bacterium]|nr:hypothetical protein [Salinivirgaceae bacterium]